MGAWRLRSGRLALGQDQRCRRVLERAGPRTPAGVIVAHQQHWRGDGQVQPHRPRIARCRSGDNSGATVRIIGIAALAQDSFHPIGQGRPLDANHGLPLRPPQHPFTGPLEGQHPSGQCNGQRREAAYGRAAPATSGSRGRGNRTCTPDRGHCERLGRPETGTRPWRQPDSRNRPSAERTDRPLAGPACGPTPPTARPRSRSDALRVLRAGQAGRRYRPQSPLPGDLRCTRRAPLSSS